MDGRTIIAATLAAVSQYTQRLESTLATLPEDSRVPLILAVQELLVNIVKHAYADQPDGGQISITLSRSASQITLDVRDAGQVAFDGALDSVSAPDPLSLPEGGMGLFIMQQAFDTVAYERLPDGNRWRLYKAL